MTPHEAFSEKKARLLDRFAAAGTGVRLAKNTSNLFRDREASRGPHLDVRAFNQVLEVNLEQGWIDAEGMTSYAALTDAALTRGVMPAVVPQLKSITIGGAAAGVGIEATSFRRGLVHETLLELEVLTGDGRFVTCTPENEHRDLFFGFPNSYGTLGYALRLKARTIPVRPFVWVKRRFHSEPRALFADLKACCAGDVDFVDGVVFSRQELYINEGRFVDEAPYASDYSLEHIYYRSIRDKPVDYLHTRDYIWRWDTDWFWCARNLGVQNPLVRRLLGRKRLNSVFYTKVMRWNSRWGLSRAITRLAGLHPESVIQDVDIPVHRSADFLEFFQREIGILPIWICPTKAPFPVSRFDLYPLDPKTLYINFGFWDVVRTREAYPGGYFNRLVEREVAKLGGIKSLYSANFYPRDEFWNIYGGDNYRRLKEKYDPDARFPDLYDKCVLCK